MKLASRILISISFFVFSVSAWADIERAFAALEAEDFETAYREFKPLAEAGNELAQRNLGVLYLFGLGVTKSTSEGLKWLTKAAEQDDASAQAMLGSLFLNLDEQFEVARDYTVALGWFRKAAEQKDGQAEFFLGFMHEHGLGVNQDFKEAVKWYTRAAEQGHADAQRKLCL